MSVQSKCPEIPYTFIISLSPVHSGPREISHPSEEGKRKYDRITFGKIQDPFS